MSFLYPIGITGLSTSDFVNLTPNYRKDKNMPWQPSNKYCWDSWYIWDEQTLHAFYLQSPYSVVSLRALPVFQNISLSQKRTRK